MTAELTLKKLTRSAFVSCLSSATSAAGRPKTRVLSLISRHSRAASWSSFLGFSSLDLTSSSTCTKQDCKSGSEVTLHRHLSTALDEALESASQLIGRPAAEVAELKQLTKTALLRLI